MNSDHNLWNIVLNGNNRKKTGRDLKGNIMILPLVSVEEHIAVQRENKSKKLYCFSIFIEDHMADFHSQDYARDIWLAVKDRFGGNDESKKMRKSMLKQEFLEFRVSESEGLHKGYDRFQKILSQLNQMQAKPDNEDCNMKFLRALPPSWSQVAITLKTKGGLDYLSFDDLYNKLRTLEIDMSYPEQSHSTTFTSASSSPAASSNVIENNIKWQMAMLSVRINIFEKKAGRKMKFNNKDAASLNRRKRSNAINAYTEDDVAGSATGDATGDVVDDVSNAGCRICPYDYLISVHNLSTFWLLNILYAVLKKEFDNLRSSIQRVLYPGFKHKKSKLQTLEQQKGMGTKAKLEKLNDKVKLEESNARFDKWKESSKNLDKLINSSMTSRSKFEKPLYDRFVKAVRMHDVPPPITGTFMPPSNKPTLKIHSKFHLIKDCDFYEKQLELHNKPMWNNVAHIPSFVPKAASVPAGSRNRPTSVPAGSRNRPHLFRAGKSLIRIEILEIIDSGCSKSMIGNKEKLDDLVKIVGGFIVGYAAHSKAYRVYNLSSKKIEETLNLRYLEDKPNVQGLGHEWYFDLDYLTDSLGYTHFKTNQPADYADELARPSKQEYEANTTAEKHLSQADLAASRNRVPACKIDFAAGGPTETSTPIFKLVHTDATSLPRGTHLAQVNILQDILLLLTLQIPCPHLQKWRTYTTILTLAFSLPLYMMMILVKSKFGESTFVSYVHDQQRNNHINYLHCLFACFLSQLEPSSVAQALNDPDWVEAMQEEMQQFINQKVFIKHQGPGLCGDIIFGLQERPGVMNLRTYLDICMESVRNCNNPMKASKLKSKCKKQPLWLLLQLKQNMLQLLTVVVRCIIHEGGLALFKCYSWTVWPSFDDKEFILVG
ncbi:hypothetical protein Tco_1293221 [Tanacetum coccineum]